MRQSQFSLRVDINQYPFILMLLQSNRCHVVANIPKHDHNRNHGQITENGLL